MIKFLLSGWLSTVFKIQLYYAYSNNQFKAKPGKNFMYQKIPSLKEDIFFL